MENYNMEISSFIEFGEVLFIALYLMSLIIIGWLGYRAKKQDNLADFYLAGNSIGLFTLFMTLYATQYSGNTLVGYAANSYREGFSFLVSFSAGMGVIGVYWLFAPRLHYLSRRKNYITIGDFIEDRYDSKTLVFLLNIIFIIVLASYILTNLKAIGYVVEVSSGGLISFNIGIISLMLIMVVYESLGGMRAVAWTDIIQGVILLLGCLIIFFALDYAYGISNLVSQLKTTRPDFWAPPNTEEKLNWISILILLSFGAAIYPQAIQRIYAAKNARTLQRTYQLMLFMPLVTTFIIFIVGLAGAARFPELDSAGSEQITLLILTDIANMIPSLHIILVLFLAAIIAAIMSTVDSALLTTSSLFTQDFYRRLRPQASQAHLTQMGKIFSWLVMGAMALLAIYLPQTIWKLIVVKLELLIQAVPAILLGVQNRRPHSIGLIIGILVGICVTVIFRFADDWGLSLPSKPLGIHAGVWGLFVNILVVMIFCFIYDKLNINNIDKY
jgi:SSS family transporter